MVGGGSSSSGKGRGRGRRTKGEAIGLPSPPSLLSTPRGAPGRAEQAAGRRQRQQQTAKLEEHNFLVTIHARGLFFSRATPFFLLLFSSLLLLLLMLRLAAAGDLHGRPDLTGAGHAACFVGVVNESRGRGPPSGTGGGKKRRQSEQATHITRGCSSRTAFFSFPVLLGRSLSFPTLSVTLGWRSRRPSCLVRRSVRLSALLCPHYSVQPTPNTRLRPARPSSRRAATCPRTP